MPSLNQASLSFAKKLKGLKPSSKFFAKCKDQGDSIPEIVGKAKIDGDKLSKIIN